MTQSCNLSKLKLILALSSAIITTSANNVLAQNITIDGTLSPAQILNGPTYIIPQSVGQTVGSNLFHSFGQFGLNQGERANFQSSADIRNIFSRVTGGFPSNINGLIFTQSSNVNLYLINPSGIVFGPNARLDVGGSTRGSFVATTADALVWSNGSQFSATNPSETSSLLTIIGDPNGFLFNSRPPKPIQAFDSSLGVFEGQSLLLLGGDVNLDKSTLFVNFIEGGRIELGAVAEPGTVGLTTNGNILSLNFPENLARADVSLTNTSLLDATAGNGGSIALNARNINVLVGSQLLAGIATGLANINSQAGDITLNATEAIRVDDASLVSNNLYRNVTGNAGNIIIHTNLLALTNNSQLQTLTRGAGNAGNVFINARDVSINAGAVFSIVEQGAVGDGGNIRITTNLLKLNNGAQLATSTLGQGNAGSVFINAREVFFDGTNGNFTSTAFSTVGQGAIGDGGSISITTDLLSLTNGAQLLASTRGQGNAGSVFINAQDISFNRGFVFSTVEQEAVGNGGNIHFNTDLFSLVNNTQLAASTSGQGNAGSVLINARDISFDDSNVFSTVEQGAVGNGSNIRITTDVLNFINGAQLLASTSGQGNAGNVHINAHDVSFDGSDVFSTVQRQAVGDGGNILITTDLLKLNNGAQLVASTFGQGNAGNVHINAHDVFLDGTSSDGNFASTAFSSVGQGAVGDGGSISITTDLLSLTNGARLNASTSGQGNAGSVLINARDVLFDSRSAAFTIVGQRAVGDGGNILINTDLLTFTNGTQLLASTFGQGNAGSIFINARNVSFDGGSATFSRVEQGAVGDGGSISITTDLLSISGGAQLLASTLGQGNAGSVTIDTHHVSLDAGVVFSTVERGAVGEGGNIRITTDLLKLSNGSQIAASTFGQGNAGNIQIKAFDNVSISGTNSTSGRSGGLFTSSSTRKGGSITVNTNLFHLSDGAVLDSQSSNDGKGGNITVHANIAEVLNGGQLVSTTSGRGSAGKITVNATDRVIINGSDATFNDRVARFGTRIANVDAASGLFVRSDGLGSAGDIEVNSPFVILDNGGRFIAESRSVNGGNISVNAGDSLLLRRGSQISTTAGTAQAGGNGGNININAGFVIALPNENSNITANAFSGTGGQVQINTQGIFGIEPRLNDSINSSDITASSTTGINGEIIINTPNVDPTQGLTNLPADTVNTASLVDSGCTAFDDKTGSQFNVTGRGGLPASPDDVLSGDAVWSDTRLTVAAKPQNGLVSRVTTPQKSSHVVSIVPATGWVFNNQGEVTLISQVAKADTYSVDSDHVACAKP